MPELSQLAATVRLLSWKPKLASRCLRAGFMELKLKAALASYPCLIMAKELLKYVVHAYTCLIWVGFEINYQSLHIILRQVFLTEYAGPLILYLVFYLRPAIVYGSEAASLPKEPVVQ